MNSYDEEWLSSGRARANTVAKPTAISPRRISEKATVFMPRAFPAIADSDLTREFPLHFL